MSNVLVTGFAPFDGERINPSARVAEALDGREVLGRRIVGRVLPCAFRGAATGLRAALRSVRPELVVCTGQAGGRAAVSVERVALNVCDARIADNDGARPIDRPVVRGGPVGYWSTLPIKAIVARLGGAGIPAEVSQTAGTFVCNHVFYALMHALAAGGDVRGGFVHLPYLPEQVARRGLSAPSLSFDDAVRALELTLQTALARRRDLRQSRGATH